MRFLMKVKMSVEKANAALKDPNFGQKMKGMIDELKPEVAYFALSEGQRCAYFIVNLNSNSDLPRIAEPFWFAFNADIEFTPAMVAEDLMKAGPDIAKAAAKYAK